MKEPDFDLSADMRLLELQRGALGLPARGRTGWESSSSNTAGLPLTASADDPVPKGAVLAVDTTAFPSAGVIPGAVVTVTLSVANEGAGPALGIVANVPLPGGASFRPGSFVWNGRSSFDDVADSFFGAGLAIGSLGPAQRATFEWKIGVKLGSKPLLVAPAVRAENAAVLGARPLSIARKPTAAGPFSGELERAAAAAQEPKAQIAIEIPVKELPIYELDDEESIVAEAAEAALSSAAPTFQRAAPAPEPQPDSEAEPEPEPPAPLGPEREAIVLSGRVDRTTIAFFERVFLGTKTPTILQHCIFGGAIACSVAPDGGDAANLKRHLDGQAQILHRTALHEKLGKKEPISEYAGELLASLDGLRDAVVKPPNPPSDTLLLTVELSGPTVGVLRQIAEDPARWDFVKARQLTLALQAESAVCAGLSPKMQAELTAALRAYAQASVAVLQKLFVRMRIDRTTGVLSQTDPALDTAARNLVGAFKLALP